MELSDVPVNRDQSIRLLVRTHNYTFRITTLNCPYTAGITHYQIQRAQYSGHKHYHGFKAHAVITPIGIAVHWYGPVDGRRHDSYVLDCSGILDRLPGLNIGGINYQMYGDSAYPTTPHLVIPFARIVVPPGSVQARVNESMAIARTCTSEWWYGIVTNTFQTLDFSRWQRQYLTCPALQYFVGMLLVNCRTCMDGGNRISDFFCTVAPSLEGYLRGEFH